MIACPPPPTFPRFTSSQTPGPKGQLESFEWCTILQKECMGACLPWTSQRPSPVSSILLPGLCGKAQSQRQRAVCFLALAPKVFWETQGSEPSCSIVQGYGGCLCSSWIHFFSLLVLSFRVLPTHQWERSCHNRVGCRGRWSSGGWSVWRSFSLGAEWLFALPRRQLWEEARNDYAG